MYKRQQEDTAGRNRYTTVIVLTANALPGAEQMYLKEGFADYITKPIKPKELERLLGRYLGWESDEQEAKTVPEGIFHCLLYTSHLTNTPERVLRTF